MTEIIKFPSNMKLGGIIENNGKIFRLIAIEYLGDWDCWDCGSGINPKITLDNPILKCSLCGSQKIMGISLSPSYKSIWEEVRGTK